MSKEPVEILLVEDNEDDSIIIQETFADTKLANIVQTVRDGEEAFAYLRREGPYKEMQQPGLVLLNINMPKKTASRWCRN